MKLYRIRILTIRVVRLLLNRKGNHYNPGLEIRELALVTAGFLYLIENSKCSV